MNNKLIFVLTNKYYYSFEFTNTCHRSKRSPFKLRTFSTDQLITILPILQGQFDSLLAFDASSKDLNNGIINSAFAMLYKDFVKLYIFYQTAIVRLLDIYFEINQLKRAQELYEAYKKFLVRMDKVSDFMRVLDSVGMDKSDMPNVSRAPSLSLKLLEKHLNQLESATKRHNQQPFNRIQSVELPKIDYTILQGRRRSLRAQNRLTVSIETNSKSPETRFGQKRPVDKSLGEQLEPTINEDGLFDKKKKDCDSKEAKLDLEVSKYQMIPSAPPYDLLTNSNYDYVPYHSIEENKFNLDEVQRDLIIMTDPSDEMANPKNGGASSDVPSAESQMTRAAQPTEWVQVEL